MYKFFFIELLQPKLNTLINIKIRAKNAFQGGKQARNSKKLKIFGICAFIPATKEGERLRHLAL